jgi:hypothetical protein
MLLLVMQAQRDQRGFVVGLGRISSEHASSTASR